jgi:hypothetical protein
MVYNKRIWEIFLITEGNVQTKLLFLNHTSLPPQYILMLIKQISVKRVYMKKQMRSNGYITCPCHCTAACRHKYKHAVFWVMTPHRLKIPQVIYLPF